MDIRKLLSSIRLVWSGSRVTRAVILGAVTLSVAVLLVLHAVTLHTQKEAEELRLKAQQLEQENQKLEEKIDNLGTLEGIKDVAQGELGLVDPDTVIITPEK